MPTKVYGHFARREIFFYRTLREVTKLMNYQHISKKNRPPHGERFLPVSDSGAKPTKKGETPRLCPGFRITGR